MMGDRGSWNLGNKEFASFLRSKIVLKHDIDAVFLLDFMFEKIHLVKRQLLWVKQHDVRVKSVAILGGGCPCPAQLPAKLYNRQKI